ncbi:helix-turn-helix domain-containing protein [Haloarchaeobius amylolyticus]|uniref:Helix-turn-helix domain-containing protein n=1 Tax=Haloarchaeobius amylolyticus TaxID=1198296 RepID=A0ABD6BI71_9EURY
MGFIAEVHLVHDDLPLVPTIAQCPGVTLSYEYGTTIDERRIRFVSVSGDTDASLEAAMAADRTVSNPTRIATFDGRTIYRVVVDTPLELLPARCAKHGVFAFTLTSGEGGWIARIYLPDRDALAALRSQYRDHGVSFRVNQLYDSSVSDERTYFLTDRQYEVLTTAYDADYFEVPRGVTQDDLADRLDISDSAVSQRLRRAISELIAATVENGRAPDRCR